MKEKMNKYALHQQIKEGRHKQFVFDNNEKRVKCRCGYKAIWWKTGYLCGTITAYPCKYN